MPKITLLIIEDEEAIRDMLRFSLPSQEFNLIDAEDTKKAETLLAQFFPDVIILDWMLPDRSGIDFIRQIRKQKLYNNIPVIFLTAKAEEENKIMGLMSGADDYITKPFSPHELIARIKTILRRGLLKSKTDEISVDNIVVNTNTHHVSIDNNTLSLTITEYKLLYFFLTHPDKTYTRDQLISYIWGRNAYLDERTIDVNVKRLRFKLKPYHHDRRIKTIRNAGYIFLKDTYDKTT